jgi:GAF domain-containing protein
MAGAGEPPPRGRHAVVSAFTVFALRSGRISETIERSIDTLIDALSAPIGALVTVVEPGIAALEHARGSIGMAPGDEFPLDEGLLREPVSPEAILPGPSMSSTSGTNGTNGTNGARRPATLSVLVTVEGEPWGRLLVHDPHREVFSAADAELARTISTVLGAAVERHRRDRRREQLEALGRYALQSRDVVLTIERAVDVLMAGLQVPAAAVVRLVPRRPGTLVVVHARGPVGAGRPRPGHQYDIDPALADALRESSRLVVPDARTDTRFVRPLLPGPGAALAYLVAAVQLDGRTWGWLIGTDERARRFTGGDAYFTTATAGVLAAALQRKRREWDRAGAALVATAHERPPVAQATEVALVDQDGIIVWVNQAWQDFAIANAGDPVRTGVGMSYLDCCDASGDRLSLEVADALRIAVHGGLPAPMRVLVPCHGPGQERWFDLLISSRFDDDGRCLGATVTFSRTEPDRP